jgi:ribosome assembly protein RRB1
MVAGTQADHATKNKVMILKLSDLHKTKHDERDDDEVDGEGSDSDEDDLDDDPILEEKFFNHPGGVNRVRVCPQHPNLVATHADTGKVHVWNIAAYVSALDAGAPTGATAAAAAAASKATPAKATPLHTFHNGVGEGYSMAWNPLRAGRLITGDGSKNIHLWEMNETGTSWTVDAAPFKSHSSSVEDLAWSPSEEFIFASASADKTIRIWDIRTKEKCQMWIAAHKKDVNVLDWNAKIQHLLVSGGDDGAVKVVRRGGERKQKGGGRWLHRRGGQGMHRI